MKIAGPQHLLPRPAYLLETLYRNGSPPHWAASKEKNPKTAYTIPHPYNAPTSSRAKKIH